MSIDISLSLTKSNLDSIAERYKKLESDLQNAKQKHGAFKPYQQSEWTKQKFTSYWRPLEIIQKGERAVNDAIKELEKIISFEEVDKKIDEENKKIYLENKKIIENFINDLVATGLKKTESFYKRNKLHTRELPWVEELRKNVPIYSSQQHLYSSISQYLKDLKKEKKRLEEEKTKIEKTSLAIKQLKEIAVSLKLSAEELLDINFEQPDLAAENLLVYALEKNKYLMLAEAMRECRMDWTDGCRGVQNALDDFNIETDEDKRIYACVAEQCEDFEDGRCFRDCECNYEYLYSLVDVELLNIYNRINKLRTI